MRHKQRLWEEVQSWLYEGAITEGVVPVEAKVIYMLIIAAGLRCSVRRDRICCGRCRPRDANLEWSRRVDEDEGLALVGFDWKIRRSMKWCRRSVKSSLTTARKRLGGATLFWSSDDGIHV